MRQREIPASQLVLTAVEFAALAQHRAITITLDDGAILQLVREAAPTPRAQAHAARNGGPPQKKRAATKGLATTLRPARGVRATPAQLAAIRRELAPIEQTKQGKHLVTSPELRARAAALVGSGRARPQDVERALHVGPRLLYHWMKECGVKLRRTPEVPNAASEPE
jgi:hypothetical protein